jgi:Flp pilus assembly protein TadG
MTSGMSRIPNLASERGAVFIQTAVAAMVLVGFGTFVADYGVLWVARHQAQNAADSGAMAGAIARAYEDFDDPPAAGGVADQTASQLAGANLVWGASSPGITSFACPPEVGGAGRCVRVDVYRNDDHGNALPTWFAPALGITSQGVRATATARVVVANTTRCLRPWAIPDQFNDDQSPPDGFKKYHEGTGAPTGLDVYTPPSSSGPGLGLRFPINNSGPQNLGDFQSLTFNDLTADPANKILRSSVVPLDLPGGYAASLAACNGQPITVGDQLPISCGTCLSTDAPSASDFSSLYDQDRGASWNAATRMMPLSPRLAAIAVFDVDRFQLSNATGNWSACPFNRPCVTVVNIIGFFIADGAGSSGYVTSYPGVPPLPTDPVRLTAASSFLKAITLVR